MRFTLAIALSTVFAAPLAAGEKRSDQREAFFELKIRPVLVASCWKCHGGEKTSNNLRLDARAAVLKGGDSGPAVVPNQPDKSLLIQGLRYSEELKMPPGKPLPAAVIADFERWVRDGAIWPDRPDWKLAKKLPSNAHWAFQPVRKVEPPEDTSGWSANGIDRFIHAAHASHGVKPAPLADRRTLLRRAYFDLIGLPPSPDEVAAFLSDKSPRAFSDVVERLLASPQYGERWGRFWMDVVRYADTAGDNADYPVPEARLYRDYIIDAFNSDKPYDEFVREQLAGDLLAQRGPAGEYAERVIATGFLALSRRYATAPYELWHLTMEDTIDTVGRAYLGMTLRCARCHDHKFDPVTTRDYYRLYGIFASTRFPYAGSEEFVSMKFPRRAFSPLIPAAQAAPRVGDYEREIARLKRQIAGLETSPGKQSQRQLKAHRVRLLSLERRGTSEAIPVAYAVSEGDVCDVNVQRHGEPAQPGEIVPRGAPRFLTAFPPVATPPTESGRLELADWIASPRNPLTARVLVNRVWQHHFGRGIVDTPSNFGTRGGVPSHPELLDWLTASFTEHGWSIKSLHRLMMASTAYRLSSASDAANEAVDSANRWCWRFQRQRLDAEAIRDAMLSVGGTLDLNRPGAHPFPPIRDWVWTQHRPFKAVYPSNHRSVYLMTQRLYRHPILGLFDSPDTNTTTDVRSSSTVPLQALFLMNSDFMRQTAGAFAARLCGETLDWAVRIRRAHELAYARAPEPAEIDRGRKYIEEYAHEADLALHNSQQAEREAWLSYARTILDANEFVYID